ncbi:glyoxylate/hydroxypyruvate reductase GhrA [Mixta intestinalis]|jgi:glyoxylate/hydroxypyruvate reductase A|uniref:Glyoxylate/hydroxypyruvate reductase A n=1 Tax=Mixta intestinalis TaxID=1615494 RepID=A0A6P1PW71_9GAMM|nr:glyoxylate/hydroxypyruvate reductase GhrA [Mixta intestinalis]QHM70790.1 Glyoxylate/hydroxypyruvate reductase A [Mixta intestinalis]
MDIIFYHPSFNAEKWRQGLQQRLPQARLRLWQPGDNQPADYALVRMAPPEMLRGRGDLKAIFAIGAGVDDILGQLQKYPDMIDPAVPLFRLEDTGMGLQMQEYAVHTVLGWFRRFDDYRRQQQQACWKHLANYRREDFTIGILGAGVLGLSVAESLKAWGFPLRCWSRSPKQLDGIESFHGDDRLTAFLADTQVLINLLPNTPQTVGIINRSLLNRLKDGAFVMNLARGAHVVEDDLLAALNDNKIKGAALDVFVNEPLSADHPFWHHPGVTITPHNAAVTLPEEAMDYIAGAIQQLEAGQQPQGRVDLTRGY